MKMFFCSHYQWGLQTQSWPYHCLLPFCSHFSFTSKIYIDGHQDAPPAYIFSSSHIQIKAFTLGVLQRRARLVPWIPQTQCHLIIVLSLIRMRFEYDPQLCRTSFWFSYVMMRNEVVWHCHICQINQLPVFYHQLNILITDVRFPWQTAFQTIKSIENQFFRVTQ